MELVKQHESYRMTKTFDNGWKAEGSVNSEETGNISMWCSIMDENGTLIGSMNYSKPKSGNISINYDTPEEAKETFEESIDLLISELTTKITEQ